MYLNLGGVQGGDHFPDQEEVMEVAILCLAESLEQFSRD